MITDYMGGGSTKTPKSDYVIYIWHLMDQDWDDYHDGDDYYDGDDDNNEICHQWATS